MKKISLKEVFVFNSFIRVFNLYEYTEKNLF